MEFVTMIFSGALDIYLTIVIYIKAFYLLFLGNSAASFATGMTILFFPFAYTSTTMSGSYTFVSKITNLGLWFYSFIFTILWLWLSKDGDIGMTGEERAHGGLSFYVFIFSAYAGVAISSEVAIISKGVEQGVKRSEEIK
jgi:hypothetical protein